MSLRKKLKLAPLNDSDKILDQVPENEVLEEDVLASQMNISKVFLNLEVQLNQSLKALKFSSPIAYVYNPVEYAYRTHSIYIDKYCTTTKKVLFLGLNPGPWGMSQTGVPFGEIIHTRDWLQINGEVGKPEKECPNRRIIGFDCKQSEISGQRFWGLMKNVCETPEVFFKHVLVHNYCPIALMDKDGKNVTPAELKGQVQKDLLNLCNHTLLQIIKLLRVEVIIAIGRFVEARAVETLKLDDTLDCSVKYMLHPSPRIPRNENWIEKTAKELHNLDLMQYFETSA